MRERNGARKFKCRGNAGVRVSAMIVTVRVAVVTTNREDLRRER